MPNRQRIAAYIGLAGTLLGGGGLAAGVVVSGTITRDINAGLFNQATFPAWTAIPSYFVLAGFGLVLTALVLFYGRSD